MGRSKLFIEVSSSRISVFRATRPAHTCLSQRLDPSAIERIWEGQPAEAAAALASMTAQFGGDATNPIVFYQSPTSASGLFSCPTQVRDVTSAARMSLSDMASFDVEDNPWSVQPIDRDRSGQSKRRHIAVCADTDEALRHLRDCCESANAIDATFVPIEAALLSRAVDTAIGLSIGDEPLISVFFGQSRSVIVAAHQQRLLLVRQVGFGTDRLTEALGAAIEDTAPTDPEGLAERLLFGSGLPKPGEDLELGGRTFSASDVLPAIQPALQRLVVEVRQSIRFGLSDEHRTPNILISGSGASIPRLDEAFGEELGCPCVADSPSPSYTNLDIAHAAHAWNHGLRVSLRENESSTTTARNSLRNALYAGSAAAVLIGAGAAALLSTKPLQPQSPSALDEAALANVVGADPAEASLRAAAVRATLRAVDHSTGSQTDMAAVLREICVLTADAAILTDIEITGDADAARCSLRGYIQGPSDSTPGQLRELIDRLHRSPLVASIRLESTQNSVLDDQTAQYFAAVLEFTSMPSNSLLTSADTVGAEDGGPAR